MLLKDEIGRTHIKRSDQPSLYLHVAIVLADKDSTVLGDETFRLVELQGQEGISTPFEFTLTLHGNSEDPRENPITFKEIIGRPVTIGIARPMDADGAYTDREDSYLRFQRALEGMPVPGLALFNGMAASFAMFEPGVYRLTLRPALWKLTLANRYRLYPQKNVRDVIKAVCELHGLYVKFRGIGDDDKHNLAVNRVQDWLQAGETDLEFVQRLMSKAHLYYYFEHDYFFDRGGFDHALVFANDTLYPTIDGITMLQYTHTSAEPLGLERSDIITQYGYEQTLVQSGVDGAFARQDSASGQDTVATVETYFAPKQAGADEPSLKLYKIYQYGGSDSLARDYTRLTTEALAAASAQFSGSSHCANFRSGHKFQAIERMGPEDHLQPVRPTLDNQWFVLTQIQHHANLDGTYENQFTALGADGLVTPVSVRDTHQGSLLATVVTAGEGVPPTDWRYYSKKNFDPVQSSVTDAEGTPARTSLWGVHVRFSSDPPSAPAVWVKLAAHMQTAPEIGALVIISRSNDESELPEVQSIVESAGRMTVKTPLRWIPDTRVGGSFSTAYGDSKSVHFGATSLSGPAELKAATDIVDNQYATEKFRDASYSKGARYSYDTANLGRAGLLNVSESYGSTESTAQGAYRKSTDDFDRVESTSTYGSSEHHTTTNGTAKSYETYNGNRTNEQTVNGNASSYTNVTGVDKTTSHIGITKRDSAIGLSNDNSVTGFSQSNSLTGLSIDNRFGVLSNHLSAVARSRSLNACINTTDISINATSTRVTVVGTAAEFHNKAGTTEIEIKAQHITLVGAIRMYI